ncbi:MAG: DUF4157 domain-containing protein [Caldilineaceae bacterium]
MPQTLSLSPTTPGHLHPKHHATHCGRDLLELQRTAGNRYVQQAVAAQPSTGPAPIVQTKLVLGPADDKYEREADQKQGSKWRRPHIQVRRPFPSLVTHMSIAPGNQGGGRCRRAAGDSKQPRRGQRAAATVRTSMEQALGADFRHVRIHTGAQANQLNHPVAGAGIYNGARYFLSPRRIQSWQPKRTAGAGP